MYASYVIVLYIIVVFFSLDMRAQLLKSVKLNFCFVHTLHKILSMELL